MTVYNFWSMLFKMPKLLVRPEGEPKGFMARNLTEMEIKPTVSARFYPKKKRFRL